jgi:hypothetical protein
MAVRRVREVVWEPPSPHYLMEKAKKGWTLVALEWEREMDEQEARAMGLSCEVPYGLRIASNSFTLEEDPKEREALTAMLHLMVQDDLRFSMNQRGFTTRDKKPWTPVSVFEMLPRLVEVAPTILRSDEWEVLKSRL